MMIYVSQIYVDTIAKYSFSVKWQQYVGDWLSELRLGSEKFEREYGNEHSLVLRISAKRDIDSVEIRGPTHYPRDKQVEFTLFLPHTGKAGADSLQHRRAMTDVMNGIGEVFARLEFETQEFEERRGRWMDDLMARPEMLDGG